ncbi:Solute-binding protein family 3/N-terminal domain-containing protein [Micrococcus flavus]
MQSAGSNKANEALRSGAIDVGSTAGSAALLNRANGAPIKTIVVANQPEWSALLTGPDSDITSIEQLEGRSVAATKGTDPYFFLIQALEGAGVEPSSVTVQNLQHADGRAALENGSVDAWAGLDPIMAAAEANGARFVHRDPDLNSYSVVNATEDFLTESPETAQVVADTYERARRWAVENPEETARILAEVAGLEESVATQVIAERTNLDISPVPGKDQRRVLSAIGPIFVDTGDVPDQEQVDEALETLFDPTFAEKAESK